MFVCFVCCQVLSGICDELITRPEEYYRLWRVVVLDHEARERGDHSPRWPAEPEKILLLLLLLLLFVNKEPI
jgi:hypothetical protein